MRAFMLVVVAWGLSCAPRVPMQQLSREEPLVLGLVADLAPGGRVPKAAPALAEEITRALSQRGLSTRLFEGDLSAMRLTELRADALAGGPERWKLLVEVKARFFNQMTGRHRWNVSVRLSLAGPANVTEDFEVPVYLDFENQREAEAIAVAASEVAARVGRLLDDAIVLDASRKSAAVPDAGVTPTF